MNGWVTFWRVVNDNFSFISTDPVDLDPSQEASIMLVVDGINFSYFVDGELVRTRRDVFLDSGYLAFAISSGTNAGFGTSCELTNVELWEIE
ncbi:MAG: hypothetical protein FVQ83_16355 [Chloroflexi bacterium]|nr:hypothetical protein [Chloroflexota bacterium]